MKRYFLIFFIVISVSGFSKNPDDTLWSRNSIRFDIGGKALGGLGFIYERGLLKKHPEKHTHAFTSIEAGIGCRTIVYTDMITGVGINRNWFLFGRKRFVADIGVFLGTKISFDPTPKYIRDMYKGWDEIPIYLDYPFEPVFIGELGLKMFIGRWFIKTSLTPAILYDQIYAHEVSVFPWAGIAFGFRFKK